MSHVYTDGSKDEGSKAGAGVAVRNPQGDWTHHSFTFDGIQDVPRAELLAIREAIRIITEQNPTPGSEWSIFSDSSSTLHGLRKWKINPAGQLNNPYRNTFKEISESITNAGIIVHFHKVKSHTDIEGNEEADTAAKTAVTLANDESSSGHAISGIHDFPDGVEIYRDAPPSPDEEDTPSPQSYAIPQMKAVRRWAVTHESFHSKNKSPWPAAMDKLDGHLEPFPSARWKGNLLLRREWLKSIHGGFKTNWSFWRMCKRKKFPHIRPDFSPSCPICAEETPEWTEHHTLLHCKHHAIHRLHHARHNEALLKLMKAIEQSYLGQFFLAADLRAYGVNRDPRDIYDENTSISDIELESNYNSDSDSDYIPGPTPDDEWHETFDLEPELPIPPQITSSFLRSGENGRFERNEGGVAPLFPAWLWPADRVPPSRPDGVCLQGTDTQGRLLQHGKFHIYLIELTYTSEASYAEAREQKVMQHRELLSHFATRFGPQSVSLIVVPLGVHGAAFKETRTELDKLKLTKSSINKFFDDASWIANVFIASIFWKRREIESSHEFQSKSGKAGYGRFLSAIQNGGQETVT
jgi:ribonuclease HI